MTTRERTTPVPRDVQDRLQDAVRARRLADEQARDAGAAALLQEFARTRTAIITPEVDDRLRAHAAGARLPEGAGTEERRRRNAQQRRYAAELGVDLGALDRWREDFGRRSAALLAAPHAVAENRVVEAPEAGAAVAGTAGLTWNGYWDPGYWWSSTDASDFSIWNAQSHFDPAAGRVGSHVRFRQRESDDHDTAQLGWANGYMVIFKMPRTGRLQVEVSLRCDFSHHFIDTDNEPGNSSCSVYAGQYLQADIYNDWSDSTPVMATSQHQLAVNATTKLEEWVDGAPVQPGAHRTVYLHSPSSVNLPVDFDFAIWVAESNIAHAVKLNDTRATVGVNASWVINDITVGVI
jgi:hypothetical protein